MILIISLLFLQPFIFAQTETVKISDGYDRCSCYHRYRESSIIKYDDRGYKIQEDGYLSICFLKNELNDSSIETSNLTRTVKDYKTTDCKKECDELFLKKDLKKHCANSYENARYDELTKFSKKFTLVKSEEYIDCSDKKILEFSKRCGHGELEILKSRRGEENTVIKNVYCKCNDRLLSGTRVKKGYTCKAHLTSEGKVYWRVTKLDPDEKLHGAPSMTYCPKNRQFAFSGSFTQCYDKKTKELDIFGIEHGRIPGSACLDEPKRIGDKINKVLETNRPFVSKENKFSVPSSTGTGAESESQ